MMKKFFLFFLLLVSVSWPVATHADTATVNDEAGLFTTDQIQSLEQQAKKLNEKIKGRVLIVTTTSNSEEPRDFADTILDDVYDQMTNAAYYDAAKAYFSKSATYVEDGVPGVHYRVDEETGKITR